VRSHPCRGMSLAGEQQHSFALHVSSPFACRKRRGLFGSSRKACMFFRSDAAVAQIHPRLMYSPRPPNALISKTRTETVEGETDVEADS
jgi:hypothetical protein